MEQAWVSLAIGTVVPLLLLRGMDTQTLTAEALKWIFAGALLIVPALLVEEQVTLFVDGLGLSTRAVALVTNFLIAGLVEEVIRFFAIDYAFKKFAPRFRDLLFISLWISMGFAIVENTFYILSSTPETMLVTAVIRLLLPTGMHLCCGAIVAGGVYRVFGPLSALAIVAAILFHGFYDWITEISNTGFQASFATLLLGLFLVGVAVRRGRVLESRHENH